MVDLRETEAIIEEKQEEEEIRDIEVNVMYWNKKKWG